MSMLAEPKRKKAWILNPKGSQWSNDDTKFGQRMLEQMGWSKGQGLGKEKDGIKEHIRPAVQNDARGLGYEGRTDDWVAHLDDFNDLLARLQSDGAGETATASSAASSKSLEERSKKSRARVHYHKFTRGKDLSRASSQDLACILGGRGEAAAGAAAAASSQPVTPVSSRPPSPPPHADSDPEPEPAAHPEPEPAADRTPNVSVDSNGLNTIHTGLSCKDYFAEKMRKWKEEKEKRRIKSEHTHEEDHEPDDGVSLKNVDGLTSSETIHSVSLNKKTKKRKRLLEAASQDEIPIADNTEQVLPAVKEKSKRKKRERDAGAGEDSPEQITEDAAEQEPIQEQEEDEEQQNKLDAEMEPPKKKKKKKRSTDDANPEEITDKETGDKPQKKKKRKNSQKYADPSEHARTVEESPNDGTEEMPVKQKRKRTEEDEPELPVAFGEGTESGKKKKKKRKSEQEDR